VKKPARIALAALALGAVVAAFVFLDAARWLRPALDWVEGTGPWAPATFVVLYIVATIICVPSFALTLGGAAIFGFWSGFLIVSIASTLAAGAAFITGRHLAGGWAARKLENSPVLGELCRSMGKEGWKLVLLTRLSPVLPYTLLNYAFALTSVKLGTFLLASLIGMTPGRLVYVWLGSLAHEGVQLDRKSPEEWAFYGLGFVATVALAVITARMAQTALNRKKSSKKPGPPPLS
jgi:uncharacterized membrane protein YdjX (TVP38/TMEM64 family)